MCFPQLISCQSFEKCPILVSMPGRHTAICDHLFDIIRPGCGVFVIHHLERPDFTRAMTRLAVILNDRGNVFGVSDDFTGFYFDWCF